MRVIVFVLFFFTGAAPVFAALPEQCGAIKFKFVEELVSQGVFGLSTPQADETTTADALDQAATGSKLGRYCELAKKAHLQEFGGHAELSELIIACQADSEGDSGDPGDADYRPNRIMAQCVIVRDEGLPEKPKWEDYNRYSIARAFAIEALSGHQNRYQVLKDRLSRARLYAKALRSAADAEVANDESKGFNFEPDYRRRYYTRTKARTAPRASEILANGCTVESSLTSLKSQGTDLLARTQRVVTRQSPY